MSDAKPENAMSDEDVRIIAELANLPVAKVRFIIELAERRMREVQRV